VWVHRSQISAGSECSGFSPGIDHDRRRYLGYTTVGRVQTTGVGVQEFVVGDRVIAWGPHGSHWLAKPDPELGHLNTIQRIEYDLTDEQAVFARLGDVALHGVHRVELQLNESVAVFGQGVVGQL
jgi:threonine dehydrogenase-like Zn-dependent dehydrogenase